MNLNLQHLCFELALRSLVHKNTMLLRIGLNMYFFLNVQNPNFIEKDLCVLRASLVTGY